MINKTQHIPVLLDEVINALSVKDDEFYIDATFGLGGYTKAILDKKNNEVKYEEIDVLFRLLKKPFDLHNGYESYDSEAPDWAKNLELSCSS